MKSIGTKAHERREARRNVHIASGVNVLAGIWLILAPFALGYSGIEQAVWNDVVIGLAIFVLAMARVGHPLRYEGVSWVNFVLGAWLIAAPFVLAYGAIELFADDAPEARWNDIIVGVIVLAMAAWSALSTHEAPDDRDYEGRHLSRDPADVYADRRPGAPGRYDDPARRPLDEPHHARLHEPARHTATPDPVVPGRPADTTDPYRRH